MFVCPFCKAEFGQPEASENLNIEEFIGGILYIITEHLKTHDTSLIPS